MLQDDAASWTFYQNLVADIADTLKERMAAYVPPRRAAGPSLPTHETLLARLSEKVTGLKKLRREALRLIGRR